MRNREFLMFRSLRRLAALAVSLIVFVAAPALAQPAMWVIKDEDSTIYLFGTIHILKPDVQWRTEAFDKAFASSDEVWLEVIDNNDQAATAKLVQAVGLDPANPLSKRLTADEWARLSAATEKMGFPAANLEPMKPWLAGITLSVVPMLKAGFDPQKGVDNTLKADAGGKEKPLRAFETTEQQMMFFDQMPIKVQVAFLMSGVDEADEGPAALDSMVSAWSAGDTKGLEDQLVAPMRDEYPELYQVLLVDRNEAWAKVLEERLAGKGISFVAVGSAHLLGPDSVQAALARRGIKAERF
ncbi:MAG: TraB/GumN family protein [Caulobacter sp.]|nr:TraB/GumN family protein [Caulobacter sp.]